MDVVASLIGLGLVAIGLMLVVFFIIHPIWSIIDCAIAEVHSKAAKAVWILLIVFTWSFGGILYGLFGAKSVLKKLTWLAVLGSVGVGVALVGLVALYPVVAKKFVPVARSQPESSEVGLTPNPPMPAAVIEQITLEPFTALHLVPTSPTDWSGSIAKFDQSGPHMEEAIPITTPDFYPVNHLAVDEAGPIYYAITTHQVGKVLPSTGRFVPIEIDPALPKLSWPSAIAFDNQNRKLVLAGRGAAYLYEPATGEWKTIPGLEKQNLFGLAFNSQKGTFYGLPDMFVSQSRGQVSQILEFSAAMAVVRTISLSPPVPTGADPERKFQLACSAGQLVILCSTAPSRRPSGKQERPAFEMYLVDASSGQTTLIRPPAGR